MANTQWWKKSVVYQIYPQSFQDSNHDGIGDLQGIIKKLPYLEKLGVNVLWLNPIYKSPQVDNGYDIADYYQIDKRYGTIADFKELLQKAHNKNIRIIMDLVVNHTSDQNIWFQESKKSRDNKYSDYYIWHDPKPDGTPPNNWGSTFTDSAWEFVPERGQYYLHLFAKEQPDLNWENPKVRKEVYQLMRYWLDLGVDGFRMDVITLLSKLQDFPDAPKDLPIHKNYYFGSSNGPREHEFLQEMAHEVFDDYDVMTVGEAANTNSDQAILYTDPKRHELNMLFQFDHMHLDYGKYGKFSDVRFKLSDLRNVFTEWQNKLVNGWNSLYWSNHDQPRPTTRFGNEQQYLTQSAKMLGTLLHMMKGTPYIFQGEELGMRNVKFNSLSDYQDIETKQVIQEMRKAGESEAYIKKVCYLKSRDNARTPFPWNDSKNGGFTDAQPWMKVSPDYSIINAQKELNDPNSVFYYYQKLISLRKKYQVIVDGKYQNFNSNDSAVYGYTRTNENERLVVICSFSTNKVNYTVPYELAGGQLLLSNYRSAHEKLGTHLILEPYEALIYYQKLTH
ncbi:alpha-glucosidase [Lactobacillus sp. ESL0679]|uniref:glycoside hydrolase family 13 protein n=1 Tax=Lactobacillus sp. ESL0679 TaxID=2983209 RepID=UPI0023F7DE8A|nr:alpha-glucosidase [Lactobacillus sp. ESL0679]MDF7681991.1 alpha-glucosidase [Lactobacillus sp. ESL0679]